MFLQILHLKMRKKILTVIILSFLKTILDMFVVFVGLLTKESKPYLSFNTRLDTCLCKNAFLVTNHVKTSQMHELSYKVSVLKLDA